MAVTDTPTNAKYVALFSLTAQNVCVVMLSSYVRNRANTPMFSSATAVVMSEVVKFLVCLFLVLKEAKYSLTNFRSQLFKDVLSDWRDNVLITIPGILYMIQNNLLYITYSNLPPAIFQVSYQLKLLTTALFSRLLLHRLLTREQWLALFVLFLGVASTNVDFLGLNLTGINADNTHGSLAIGMSSVIISCLLSGLAGVYFEKLLKGSHKSVAIRNIQLGFIGLTSGFISVFVTEGKTVSENGFFYGYDTIVWIVILLQSLGGLLVAAVVKYADSILKGYATSISIVFTFILSAFIYHSLPTYNVVLGSVFVIISTVVYSYYPYVNPKTSILPVQSKESR